MGKTTDDIMIKNISTGTRRWLKVFALSNDLTIPQAIERLLDMANQLK